MIGDLEKLARLIKREPGFKGLISAEVLAEVTGKEAYPIYSFCIGTTEPSVPVLFITGGIHGLERIGAQLAWSLLKTTVDRLLWDKALKDLLSKIRLVFLPLVNPVGYYSLTRSNGRGVDLMRNSPIVAKEKVPPFLGGQRFSSKLPWYQGEAGRLELESQLLVDTFTKQAGKSQCVISLDFHSGFGFKDRLWFPFSYTQMPFDDLSQMHALTDLLEQTHPYHIYQIEPQSKGYLLSGDLWDYLFLEFKRKNSAATFLPLTLEMGSWNWVRKNPLQLFSLDGAFNPIKEHRIKRTYRRHHLLFDFLLKALNSHEVWTQQDVVLRQKHQRLAMERWYE